MGQTDTHMGQTNTHGTDTHTYGTDTHTWDRHTHLWDRHTFLTFFDNGKNRKIHHNYFSSCLIALKICLLPAQLHGDSGKIISFNIECWEGSFYRGPTNGQTDKRTDRQIPFFII